MYDKPTPVGCRDGHHRAQHRIESAHGLLAGSQVLTQQGVLPVEMLQPGDKIITRNAGLVPLLGLEHDLRRTETVRIRGGSLGHNRPDCDAILPASQRILLRDWRAQAIFGQPQALIEARRLIDGEFVTHQPAAQHRLFRLRFDLPQVIYSDGLELEATPIRVLAGG